MINAALGILLAGCVVVDKDPNQPNTDADPDEDVGSEVDTDIEVAPSGLASRVVATGLENPFEIALGPDKDTLWVTERTAGRLTEVDLETGAKTTLLTLQDVLVTPGTQDGLLGLMLSPKLRAEGHGAFFLAYSYGTEADRQLKIVRYTYDPAEGVVLDRVVLDGLPASNDHNGGRLVLGPDRMLYYSIGDQGHNQLSNYCMTNEAQTLPTLAQISDGDWSAYQGKILRMRLDGGIPRDNPVFDGVQSHIWSVGHRNPQGLAFSGSGRLYEAEHGPKSDDEINLIEGGGNYGWPFVAGYQDDQAYVYADWSASTDPSCEELTYSDFEIPPSVPQQEESAWSHPDFHAPIETFYTVPDDFDFQDPACAEGEMYFICWPTIAPSSLAWIGNRPAGIEGIGNSLLVTSLKMGTLFQVKLDGEGQPAADEAVAIFQSVDRFRDTAFAQDGHAIYLATDTSGFAMGADGAPTNVLTNPGAILELTEIKAE